MDLTGGQFILIAPSSREHQTDNLLRFYSGPVRQYFAHEYFVMIFHSEINPETLQIQQVTKCLSELVHCGLENSGILLGTRLMRAVRLNHRVRLTAVSKSLKPTHAAKWLSVWLIYIAVDNCGSLDGLTSLSTPLKPQSTYKIMGSEMQGSTSSRHVQTKRDGAKCYQTEKKISSWLSRAQARLACLAVVSSGIQGHPMLCVSLSFHPPFDNSSPISPSPPPLLSMTGVLMITSGGGTN